MFGYNGSSRKGKWQRIASFAFCTDQTKKNQYFFLSDFRNLNKQLKNNHI